MSRRRIAILFGLALGLLQPGCVTTTGGKSGLTAQKPREPATLPPAESAELCLAVSDQMVATGHHAEAVYQLQKVRALDPKADVSPRLCRLLAKIGKDEAALVEFDLALKANPKDAALWNDLGYFHYERGNWRDAEKNYRKALELAPDNQKAWLNLGLALGQAGKYKDSLAAFEQTVKPAEARCNLAFVVGTQGKLDEARRLYQEALQLDPSLKLARVALSKLDRAPTARSAPVAQATLAQPAMEQVPQQQVRTTLPPTPRVFEYPEP